MGRQILDIPRAVGSVLSVMRQTRINVYNQAISRVTPTEGIDERIQIMLCADIM